MKTQTIFFLIPLILFLVIQTENANAVSFNNQNEINVVQEGKNYDLKFLGHNATGAPIYQWTSTPDKLEISKDNFVKFRTNNTNDFISFESANIVSKINKNTCNVELFNGGFLQENEKPAINEVSQILKTAVNGSDSWSMSSLNNSICSFSYSQDPDGLTVNTIKSSDIGIFKTISRFDWIGTLKQSYEFKNTDLTNNNSKFGFTQQLKGSFLVTVGNSTYNTAKITNDVIITKESLGDQILVIKSTNGNIINFDTQNSEHHYLWVLKISSGKIIIDYTYAKGPLLFNETLSVDPTFSSNAPTVDEHLTDSNNNNTCESSPSTFNKYAAGTSLYAGMFATTDGEDCARATFQYDISSITSSASISSVHFKYSQGLSPGSTNNKDCVFTGMSIQPSTDTNANVWSGIGSGTWLTRTTQCKVDNTNNIDVDLSTNGTSYIAGRLASGWAALGVKSATESPMDANYHSPLIKSSRDGAATPKPTLEIVYSTGTKPDKITTIAAYVKSSTAINIQWTAPNMRNGTFQAYKVYKTTPYGNPFSSYLANTTNAYYNATGLVFGTQYSFGAVACTQYGCNTTGTIANATTTTTTYATTAPTLTAFGRPSHLTQIDLEYPGSNMQSIRGYKIERETPVGGGFSNLVTNTTSSSTNYNNTGVSVCTVYNYRVTPMNGSGFGTASNQYAMTTYKKPDKVTTLTATPNSLSAVDLAWTTPAYCAPSLLGYQINYTTPYGNPLTVLVSNTHSTATSYQVTGIAVGSKTSYRVSPITIYGFNGSGNIANATTFSDFTIGSLSIPGSSAVSYPIRFIRSDPSSTQTVIGVIYPKTDTLACNLSYKYAATSTSYSGLIGSTYDTSNNIYNFTFNNLQTELINMTCNGVTTTSNKGTYLLSASSFPLKDLVNSFRNGTFHTEGQFGAFDLITLIVIIASMVGFNKENPAAGIIISVAILFATSWFGFITMPTKFISVIALVIMVAIITTRKPSQ